MKTRITAILMSAVLVLQASCSQGDDLSPAGGTADGLVPVTLSVAVAEDGAATRATTAGEDELPTRGFVQIFTTEDNGQTIVPAGGDLAGVKPMTSNGGGSFSLSGIYLNPNDTYVFLYWADNAASTAPAPDDMNSVTYTAGTIAFAHSSDPWNYTTSGNANISATLTHAVAKVTLKTTTDLEAGSITVTLPTTYTTYDVTTGAVAGNAAPHDYSFTATSAITGTTDGTEVFSFYALVADELQTVTITNADENISSEVTNVPLAPNRHTTLVGDVRNVGMEEVTFTAGIDEDWGDGGTIHFMPHNINEGDVTIDGGQHYITGDGTETQNTITITGDAKVYLENVNINSTDGSAISITGGNPTIHVRGKNTAISSNYNFIDGGAGIYVAQGSSVTITGNDRNDVLWAQTSANGAGSGGHGRAYYSEAPCGNITIENVTVYAYACVPNDEVFPGIGSSLSSGTIKIKDATVHAYGSTDVIGGQFPPTAIGASNVPVIIIEKSDIYAHRGTKHDNRNADYIGRSRTGIYDGTEEIQCGTGGSITNTTVYCYTGSSDTVDKTYWFDASGSRTEQ